MYYQLKDSETQENLGVVKVLCLGVSSDCDEEIRKSWSIVQELSEDGNVDVDYYVEYHNENFESQIERIFLEEI